MNTGSSFTVRFLRNGDTISIERNIVDGNGQGTGLFQAIDNVSGEVKPNWKADVVSRPEIHLSLRSALGYEVDIKDVRFAFNGQNLSFSYNGSTWVAANEDARFMSCIVGNIYKLKIVDNLASLDSVGNKTISYEIDYVSQAVKETIGGSVDVLIQQSGSDSHNLIVSADDITLDAKTDKTTLRAKAYYGIDEITLGQGGYTLAWYKDGTLLSGKTSATLSVSRDDINGGSYYTAKLLKDGKDVAQGGVYISDIADEYQIYYKAQAGKPNVVSMSQSAVYELSLMKNGTEYAASSITWKWTVYDALHDPNHIRTVNGSNIVTINAEDCLCTDSRGLKYYADACVHAEASFT